MPHAMVKLTRIDPGERGRGAFARRRQRSYLNLALLLSRAHLAKVSHEVPTVEELKRQAALSAFSASVQVQVQSLIEKLTRDQKPYLELHLRDSTAAFLIRVWHDQPCFVFCSQLRPGDAVSISGEFAFNPNFGLEAKEWSARFLTPEERASLLAGPERIRAKQAADYEFILDSANSLRDPRLRLLSTRFLEEFGDRFRRSAAARSYHHARRGGLVEHVAQMLRSAEALATVYTDLNRDLLLAGVLFHDSGKMWENCYPKESFEMPFDVRGELVGHISIGIELINRLWSQLRAAQEFTGLPDSESVRLHLIHLVAAHHGEKEFGSPVEPKTPEAIALHFIDNLDAKLEVIFSAYATGHRLNAGVIERVRPLPGNIVIPLPGFEDAVSTEPSSERPNS